MPRTYTKKGVHTSPENAGIQNMPDPSTMPKDEDGIMNKLMPVYKRGRSDKAYNGQWTDKQFTNSIDEFFTYCNSCDLKPTRPALQLWLGVSRAQYHDWKNKAEKYEVKSDILNRAELVMEMYLQSNIDKYPTGSIFLLKATHGLQDMTKVEVTNTTQAKPEEVSDMISKLGLDKNE